MIRWLNHPITVGDVLMVGGIVALILFLLFVVLALNMGWVR